MCLLSLLCVLLCVFYGQRIAAAEEVCHFALARSQTETEDEEISEHVTGLMDKASERKGKREGKRARERKVGRERETEKRESA